MSRIAFRRRHRPGHDQLRPGLRRHRRRRRRRAARTCRFRRSSQPGVVEERPLLPSFLYLPGPERAAGRQPEAAVGGGPRLLRRRVRPQLRQPGADAAGRVGQVVAVPSRRRSPGSRSCRGRRRRTAASVSPLEASTLLSQAPRRGLEPPDRQGRGRASAGEPGHHPDRAGVVRRRGPRADRRGGPGGRAGAHHAARRAAGRVLRLDRRQPATSWREQVEVGDVVLVCDVGGGTTDFIADRRQRGGRPARADARRRRRPHPARRRQHGPGPGPSRRGQRFAAKGIKLDAGQMHMLWHSCRLAKETLFADPKLASAPVTVLGRGSKVIGGTIKGELTRAEVEKVLVDGFFPAVPADAEPQRQRAVGLQELGPALRRRPGRDASTWPSSCTRNAEVLAEQARRKRGKKKAAQPDGGAVQRRRLQGGAAARAAARRARQVGQAEGGGVARAARAPTSTWPSPAARRTTAWCGAARASASAAARPASYYIGVETSLPAVPGSPPPIKALCVVPFGMEEGTESRRARPGVRPGRRRAGRVSLPRLDASAATTPSALLRRGMGRPDRRAGARWRRRSKRPARKAARCRCICTAR